MFVVKRNLLLNFLALRRRNFVFFGENSNNFINLAQKILPCHLRIQLNLLKLGINRFLMPVYSKYLVGLSKLIDLRRNNLSASDGTPFLHFRFRSKSLLPGPFENLVT